MQLSERQNSYTELQQLLKRFLFVRRKTEELCLPLTEEDLMLSVTEDTSPAKWHLAHTSWFFEHFLLKKYRPDYESFKPEFNFLFNSYYKRLGTYLPKSKRAFLSRPTGEEVFNYRQLITESVQGLFSILKSHELAEAFSILELGINHEEQHQELLLMDIKRNFFENPLRPQYQTQVYAVGEMPDSEWRKFHSGMVKVGVAQNETHFAYDNENDRHRVWLESFELSSHLITNDEYAAFIDEGGYDNPRFWLSDGWDLKEKENWQCPLYWEKNGQNWWTYTLSGMTPLDLAAPVVHVSYYEAIAFANWRKCRLPRETEWETAANLEPIKGNFLEHGSFQPEVSDESHDVFSQIHGSVWEWTMSAFLPYPRFQPFAKGLSEYNEKFMCNQFVLRGGCGLTPQSHYRTTYRNFYYPHNRWMYSGIRLAKDLL